MQFFDFLCEPLRMGRPAVCIDVHAVRPIADHGDFRAQCAVNVLRDLIGCAVRAVENDLFAVQFVVDRFQQMLFVKLLAVFFGLQAFTDQLSGDVAVDIYAADDDIFDLFFQQVIQLIAAAVKKLDAVVFKTVVRSTDDNAGIRFVILR